MDINLSTTKYCGIANVKPPYIVVKSVAWKTYKNTFLKNLLTKTLMNYYKNYQLRGIKAKLALLHRKELPRISRRKVVGEGSVFGSPRNIFAGHGSIPTARSESLSHSALVLASV